MEVNAETNILEALFLDEDEVKNCFPLLERIIAKKVILLIVLFVTTDVDDDDFSFVDVPIMEKKGWKRNLQTKLVRRRWKKVRVG